MKVYLFLADGFEVAEAVVPWDMLMRAGADVCAVSIMPQKQVASTVSAKIFTDYCFDDVDFSDADMLILPGGGGGTRLLSAHEGLRDVLLDANAKGKLIAAICAAPSVLGQYGLLKGKNATSFPSFQVHLDGATVSDKPVVRDGNIITAMAAGVSFEFGFTLVEALYGHEIAEKVKNSVFFRGTWH